MRPAVSIIVPARDEARRLDQTLRALQGLGEIIVVDDCSRDDTAEVARALGATVIARQDRPGKGRALQAGLGEASGEVVAFVDADLGDCAGEIVRLVDTVTSGHCDLAVAKVRTTGRGGLGTVVGLTRWLLRRMGVPPVTNPLSGQRAVTRRALPSLLPLSPGWGAEAAMLVDGHRAGLVIREVPTSMVHRGTGWGWRGITHRAYQCRDILVALAARVRP
ncbi:MAG: glycosyltransferase family 2 protein [Bacillota bacterium]